MDSQSWLRIGSNNSTSWPFTALSRIGYLLTLFLVCSLEGLCNGGPHYVGGMPGEFMYYGTCVRSMAMGWSYAALDEGAGSMFHNPAGLMRARRQLDASYMYFNPLTMSKYNSGVVAVSRPRNTPLTFKIPLTTVDINPAFGLGIIDFRTPDFDRRDADDKYYGSFDIYQQAFVFSIANRYVSRALILDWGITYKLLEYGSRAGLYEAFGGASTTGSTWDFGIQVQFIHLWPTFLRWLPSPPLRILLPLRIGLAVQNVSSTGIGLSARDDPIPRILRWGACYGLRMRGKDVLLLTSDIEHRRWSGGINSWHWGTEYSWHPGRYVIAPRLGTYHVQQDGTRVTLGVGLGIPLGGNEISLDFAWGLNPDLDNDVRISLNAPFGDKRNAEYFYEQAVAESDCDDAIEALAAYPRFDTPMIDFMLSIADTVRIVSVSSSTGDSTILSIGIPRGYEISRKAALLLEKTDSIHDTRYSKFVGGWHYFDVEVSAARGSIRDAEYMKAKEAINYAFDMRGRAGGKMNGKDSLVLAEAFLIKAIIAEIMDSANAADTIIIYADSALYVLRRLAVSQKERFLEGVAYVCLAKAGPVGDRVNWRKAADLFRAAWDYGEDPDSIVMTAELNEADCWLELSALDSSIELESPTIEPLIGRLQRRHPLHQWKPAATYLPYPRIKRNNASDRAECLIGRLYECVGAWDKAMEAYATALRFYPLGGHIEDYEARERLLRLVKERLTHAAGAISEKGDGK